MGSNDILSRIDRINAKINRAYKAHREASTDSLKKVYKGILSSLSRDKRLIEASTGASSLLLAQSEILSTERKELATEKKELIADLKEEKKAALLTHTQVANFIQSNIFWISMGVELFIFLILSFLQWYHLQAASIKSNSPSITKESSPLVSANDTKGKIIFDGMGEVEVPQPSSKNNKKQKKRKKTYPRSNRRDKKRLHKAKGRKANG